MGGGGRDRGERGSANKSEKTPSKVFRPVRPLCIVLSGKRSVTFGPMRHRNVNLPPDSRSEPGTVPLPISAVPGAPQWPETLSQLSAIARDVEGANEGPDP